MMFPDGRICEVMFQLVVDHYEMVDSLFLELNASIFDGPHKNVNLMKSTR